ncbi:rhomboid family intramembrane serine protease [Natronomonas marina]|jgi:membrane associated rhomboid family serine protease|uniref:rhomboid family intramembrane serine protease n=1 Tax=Natronomonas marina TaxID=2961939 RepID=UPI0020C9A5AD|nr:rhomboid family intramembrane serine protease [Natronomonas marina]
MGDRPTLTTLCLFAVVFAVQAFDGALGVDPAVFVLRWPLTKHPSATLVSVYAHGSLQHLAANTLALAVVGPLVAYVTSPIRFHLFFVVSGALSGIAQVLVTVPFGGAGVLGGSGAIFALMGYFLVGNRASTRALSWLPLGTAGSLLLFGVLAAVVTLATAAPGVALVAHFTGFLVGAVAGRGRLLHVGSDASPQADA